MMKVSVAMCTYNGERFLERQVRSVLAQTRPVDEIIVCDDLSSDGTLAVLESMESPVLRVHVNSTRLGYRKNFFQAASMATGDIVFLADQDDEWLPSKVEQTLEVFANTSCAAVFSDGYIIDEEGRDLGSSLFVSSGFHLTPEKNADLFTLLTLGNNVITGAAFAFRRNALFDFSDSLLCHDHCMGLAWAARNQLSFVDKKLIRYRVHSAQCFGVKLETKPYYLKNIELLHSSTLPASLWAHYLRRRRFCFKLYRDPVLGNDFQVRKRLSLALKRYDSAAFQGLKKEPCRLLHALALIFLDLAFRFVYLPFIWKYHRSRF